MEPSQQLIDLVGRLEIRIQHLEKMLGVEKRSDANPAVAPPPSIQPIPSLPPTVPNALTERRPQDLSLLGTGGILCLVLAAIYLIKLAVDSGWLGPVQQIALAVTLAIGLIVAGFRIKSDDQEYISYLPAAGIVILFLSILGGSLYHNLYGPTLALLLIGGTAAATILIYDELRMFAYLVLSKIGTYLAPFAFIGAVSSELVQVYFLVMSTAYTVIAVLLNLRPIAVLAAYFALFATSVFGFHDPANLKEASLYMLCEGLIFLGGTLYHTFTTKSPLAKQEALLYFPLILFFYGLEYAFISQIYPGEAPYMSLGFAALLLGIYSALKAKLPKGVELPSEDVLMSAAFTVITHSVYFVLLPNTYQPIFFMALLLVAAYLYNQVFVPTSWALFRKMASVVGGGLLVWNFASVMVSLVRSDESIWIASGFFMSGGLVALLKLSPWAKSQQQQLPWLLYAPHLMVAASLYALLKNAGSFAVSASWAVYALAILGYGITRNDKAVARSSMVVLILSSLKVFFYDLSGTNTVARVLSLLVTGGLLYTAGWVFRKIS